MAKTPLFEGAAVALVTPMKQDSSIDFARLEERLEEQITQGISAIILAGTTGEGSTLSAEEFSSLISFGTQLTHGRIPVLAGAGSNDTKKAIALSRLAEEAGADGLLQITPYYNKTNQRGVFEHFKQIAKSTRLPIILYNVPGRTGVNIQPQTAKKLAGLSNVVGIKEASGDLKQVGQIASLCGEDLPIYSGNDELILPVLSLGGKGVISVLANLLPAETAHICNSFFAGEICEARTLQIHYLPLIAALFSDVNPICIKQALHYVGKDVGPCRLPLMPMEDKDAIALLQTLREYQLA